MLWSPFPLPCFNAKLFLRPGLHRRRRRSRFQCAPHDLPRPNRDTEQQVYPIRRYSGIRETRSSLLLLFVLYYA